MIRIDENYTDFRDDDDPNYPGGKAVDAPTPESIEGTPILAKLVNCINGFRQAVFQRAFDSLDAISGEPDHANKSDTLDAIERLIANGDKETLKAVALLIDNLPDQRPLDGIGITVSDRTVSLRTAALGNWFLQVTAAAGLTGVNATIQNPANLTGTHSIANPVTALNNITTALRTLRNNFEQFAQLTGGDIGNKLELINEILASLEDKGDELIAMFDRIIALESRDQRPLPGTGITVNDRTISLDNITLTNAAASSNLPATTPTAITTLLQTVRNCLRWLVETRAPIASPTFTGTPDVPAASAAVAAAVTPTAAQNTRIATVGQIAATRNAINGDRAPIANPTFTGTPRVPNKTAAAVNDGTLIATEAQVFAFSSGLINSTHPVGAYYTQYPVVGATTHAAMFPANRTPAQLFGGTWTERFSGEEVFFRTTGGNADTSGSQLGTQRGQRWNGSAFVAGGAVGIEPDMIRNATGTFPAGRMAGTVEVTGAFSSINTIGSVSSGSAAVHNIRFSLSDVVPTGTLNTPRNRLIRIWERTA